MPAPAIHLADFPSSISLPIQWGDQDALGHVNNTVVIRWFESSRVAYMEQMGLEAAQGVAVGPILAAISCNYRRQMNYPGQVIVATRVLSIGRTSCTMQHAVFVGDELTADGEGVVVLFDYAANRPVPFSPELRQAIGVMEGREFA